MLSKFNVSVTIASSAIAGIALIGITAANSVYVNDETERAIVTNSGKYVETTGPGMHWKVPFQESYRQYPVSVETLKIQGVSTSTVDNYAINATIVLLYRLPEEKLENIHRNVPDYREQMEVVATSRFKNELGNIKMDEEAKQAEIKAEQKQIEAKAEADAKIEAARGEAEANRLAAKAEAESIRMKGEAEADALEAKSQALQQNPQLVELEKAKKWNGQLPQNMYGQAPIPFLQTSDQN